MRDDHRDLRLFLHLAGTLNFGRTSLDCHVSPATLTRTVQRLETELGHRLLDRGPRGVALTAEGHRFRAYAAEALELWQAYREEHPDPAELTGRLAVFATVTACQALLPTLLAPLRAAHPQVRIDLRTGDAAAALARLDEGEADVALAGVPARLPESLVSRTVATTDLVFVTARERPDAGLDGPFVLPHRGLVRDAADRWFRSHGLSPDPAAEPEGHEALLTLVALGCGTGVVPRLVLDHSAVRDRLTVIPTEQPPPPFPIGLCVRRADLRRPHVAALWSLTAEFTFRSP
ncbi:HTH-type transcriptional activator IlvY [Streptomyces caniscabiei]|uniref:HTH-type transcriptional activator IlvY n=1 Tax=Streptomyces caniscabiei TaxID=2746961 RepID=UPI0029B01A97|nr:HTH-type transcriptional activator IlvY [Streptomyces caniscabiei]MDX2605425.1 HTH-type transcriptional activator IlvY [Streptomyces caniscabiei]MDX2735963.1 HTH-type transcriptional activator IlvY [Streptomyces caniscabiei]MDX2778551.1 HTH-type transcriptional activator IlvY [Streptomyces caniscabiei]